MKKTLTATIQANALVNAAAKRNELPSCTAEQGWYNRRTVVVCKHGLNIQKDTKTVKVGRTWQSFKRITITPCKSWMKADDYTRADRRRIALNVCKALRAQGIAVKVVTTKPNTWDVDKAHGAQVVGEWRRGR